MNRGNIVNLEDIDDVGVIGVDTPAKQEKQVIQEEKPKLIRGAVKENVVVDDEDGFTDLSQLKNLKILTEEANDTDEDDTVIENLDDAISRQIAVMTSMKESFEELREEQDRIDGIQVIGEDDEEEELDADNDDDEDSDFDADEEYDDAHEDSNVNDDVSVKRVPSWMPDAEDDEETEGGILGEDEELETARRLKREEELGVRVGTASKNSKNDSDDTIRNGKGKVKKKTQARVQGNLSRLRNAVNMAGAFHDTYLPKSNLIFRTYKPTNSIALDNRTIQGDWIMAGRDKLRATLKEFYENGLLRCAENISFEVFLRSISYRDLKYINCGIASTIVDKWEMDIGMCKHVDADGPCNKVKESETIVLPIRDVIQKSYKAEELERMNRYDNTKTITELQSDTLFGQCEVYEIDITDNRGDRTGTMKVYTSEASVERFLSVMRTVDDYLISILVDERPDMRAIAGNLNTEELLYQVKEIMPERSQEAYGVAIVMLGIGRIEVGTVAEDKVVEFKVEDVRSYEELFELFTIIDSRIMAKLATDDKQQEMIGVNSFKFKYKRKCKHITTVVVESELVLNLPRRALLV